jgi:hypothetical protein
MHALRYVIAASALAVSAHAQGVPVGDPAEDYLRLLALTGHAAPRAFGIRPVLSAEADAAAALTSDSLPAWARPLRVARERPAGGGVAVTMFDAAVRLTANSAFPWGQNDGAVWRGKGVTATAEWGARLRWGRLSLTLRPALTYTGNAAFALAPDTAGAGYSPFASPWQRDSSGALRIDLPQRFGGTAFWTLDPGQSALRVSGSRFTAGVGTENLWWGPARHGAIVMSNHAAGFPHASVATNRPLSVGVGTVEWQWIWGRLSESRYFDTTAGNDRRFLTGIVGTFQPRPFPGLTLGGTRVFVQYYPAGGLPLGDYLLVFQGVTKNTQVSAANPSGNDARDQLASLFARWAPAASGFEAYVEWARNDHSGDWRDLLVEPEHSQGYTLGFQQVVPRGGGRLLRLAGELTHLERSNSFQVRPVPTWYVHHVVRQGYTQRGQVIGAAIGPGGNGQRLEAEVLAPWGRVGIALVRQVRDNDALYVLNPGYVDSNDVGNRAKHDVTAGLVAGGALLRGRWTLTGEIGLLRNYNRFYVSRDDLTNVTASLAVRFHPPQP